MSEYSFARSFAIAWLRMNKVQVKDSATSMKIARLVKCWDGVGGASKAKQSIIDWHNKALSSGSLKSPKNNSDDFYSSQAWRSVRYEALKRSNGCCSLCGAPPGRHQLHVDHIAPRSKYPHLALDILNLQVLCRDCNLGKSNKDSIDWRKNTGEAVSFGRT